MTEVRIRLIRFRPFKEPMLPDLISRFPKILAGCAIVTREY